MNIDSEIIKNIKDIREEIIELNNIIDKKCLDIYNQNNINENKINAYQNYLESVILEYHKMCKIMYSKIN